MTYDRMREIAQAVCDYADEHGYARDKDVDEIVEDLESVWETGALERVTYLFEYIDYDSGEIWDLVASVWADNPWGTT